MSHTVFHMNIKTPDMYSDKNLNTAVLHMSDRWRLPTVCLNVYFINEWQKVERQITDRWIYR